MREKLKNIARFNCQGLNSEAKKINITDDFIKFNLTVIMMQEIKKQNFFHHNQQSSLKH